MLFSLNYYYNMLQISTAKVPVDLIIREIFSRILKYKSLKLVENRILVTQKLNFLPTLKFKNKLELRSASKYYNRS
jgi:hypothetical protein